MSPSSAFSLQAESCLKIKPHTIRNTTSSVTHKQVWMIALSLAYSLA